MGDVRHCRLLTVEEAKEDVPSMSSVPVNFLCCLLGQAAHRTLHPASEQKGPQSLKQTKFDREIVTITLKVGILSHIVSAGSLQVVVLVPLVH